MTKEEKELLLIDLCSRLPYGFVVHRYGDNRDITFGKNELNEFSHFLEYSEGEEFKPYLRPIHKLTKEELEELEFLTDSDYVDYCNEHHIDYRNLIPKGLALEAKDGMYKTE